MKVSRRITSIKVLKTTGLTWMPSMSSIKRKWRRLQVKSNRNRMRGTRSLFLSRSSLLSIRNQEKLLKAVRFNWVRFAIMLANKYLHQF